MLMLTLKSTPIVALASSSGSHCESEKRSKRLLLPTDAFPMRRSLTLTGCCWGGTGGIEEESWVCGAVSELTKRGGNDAR